MDVAGGYLTTHHKGEKREGDRELEAAILLLLSLFSKWPLDCHVCLEDVFLSRAAMPCRPGFMERLHRFPNGKRK